ncbi:signal peptidase, membrane protein [Corynebacterium halotolerans YIM 70093 = DSM 44683]|uniref:Signal peptidase, membrane protein n=1 Tax=Corynebacterium halotolerans YIM 70093 = DSM 44683 TaxID=1121362 RepID=M1NSZ6_9CORY|nr:signal peptidase, membrane protein [Corynebacterium halotolerans YIM 70093 = DSM 44683]
MVVVAWAVALCLHDLHHRRLPDALTLPAALGAGLGALLTAPPVLLGGLAWAGLYVLVGLRGTGRTGGRASRRGIGGGDVKLALSLGTLAAAAGVTAWFAAVLGASLITLSAAVGTRSKALPHGPSMVAATALAVAFGADVVT